MADVSVVQAERIRRWTVVGCAVAALLATPTLVAPTLVAAARDRLAAGPPGPSTTVLVARMLASSDVPHAALAQSRGTAALPDLPRFSAATALLGGTTRTRVWWDTPDRWRVDTVTTTGERDTYRVAEGLVTWDYEDDRLVLVLGTDGLRLPRADDLLPPQAARRLLAALGPADRVQALPGRRVVAGRQAVGVRITPGDERATIGSVDIWADPGNGLPLELTVRGRQGQVALQSSYQQVDLRAPDPALLRPPDPPLADRDVRSGADLVQRIDRSGSWRLPDRLAGVARAPTATSGGTAVYGTSLAGFVVLPLPARTAGQALASARTSGAAALQVTGGDAVQLRRGVLGVVLAQGADGRHAYLIGGPVRGDLLRAAAQDLLGTPPPEQDQAR